MSHDDDLLPQRLRDDAGRFARGPRAGLRADVFAGLAAARAPRLGTTLRAAALAAVLLACAGVAWWWLLPRGSEPAPDARAAWVVETIDEDPRALEAPRRVASSPRPSQPLVVPDVPWIGGGGDATSWAKVMAHPFDSEWQRLKADATRAGDVVWDRVARPLAAVFGKVRR